MVVQITSQDEGDYDVIQNDSNDQASSTDELPSYRDQEGYRPVDFFRGSMKIWMTH